MIVRLPKITWAAMGNALHEKTEALTTLLFRYADRIESLTEEEVAEIIYGALLLVPDEAGFWTEFESWDGQSPHACAKRMMAYEPKTIQL